MKGLQFCRMKNKDGTYSFDWDEFHAICLGLLLPIPMWWPICRWNVGEPARLLGSEGWYVAFGITLRMAMAIIIWRCL